MLRTRRVISHVIIGTIKSLVSEVGYVYKRLLFIMTLRLWTRNKFDDKKSINLFWGCLVLVGRAGKWLMYFQLVHVSLVSKREQSSCFSVVLFYSSNETKFSMSASLYRDVIKTKVETWHCFKKCEPRSHRTGSCVVVYGMWRACTEAAFVYITCKRLKRVMLDLRFQY